MMRAAKVRETSIQVMGGGPAGSAAAIAALCEGSPVELFEPSRFPRHKVCGEFLSPEIGCQLEALGLGGAFQAMRPARISSLALHFHSRSRQWTLPETAFGMSRYEFDRLLFEKAAALGASLNRERLPPRTSAAASGHPLVAASGRKNIAPRGRRLFGFKAHFTGPADDVVNLFFFSRFYAGVSAVENGITNVCGIAAEEELARYDFEIDNVIAGWKPLARRLAPLARVTRWYQVGPLVFGSQWDRLAGSAGPGRLYPAGDALGFLDPFTGTGLVHAVASGRLAGLAASRGTPPCAYLAEYRRIAGKLFWVARFLRVALVTGLAESLGPWIPPRFLFRLTRLTGCSQ